MKNVSGNKIPWSAPGDLDAAIGVFFDGFSKIIIGATIMMGVMKMPSEFVFGRIVAAIGLSAFVLLAWNTIMARRVGIRTNNLTITALPGGIAAGTFFVWINAIMIPVYLSTGDYVLAWKVGLLANVFHSIFTFISAFVMDRLLEFIPSPAIFSGLAGGSLAWLVMATLGDGFATPIIIIPSLFVLLTMYFAKIQLKKLSPAVVGIGVGTIIAWISGAMDPGSVTQSFKTLGIYIAIPSFGLFSGEALSIAIQYLPLILAFAFADVIGAIQAIEQAAAGNDNYDRRIALIGLACSNFIGALLGNPFVMAYYWGHPAWKKAKAGSSYPLYVGVLYLVLCATGLVAIATSVLPAAATMTLIIYAGLTSTAQAFEVNERKYYPAMALGVAIPIFELIYGKVNSGIDGAKLAIGEALSTGGIDFPVKDILVTPDHLASAGLAKGFLPLSQGSMLIAIIYVATLAFVIDRKWTGAAISFIVASACSFIGLIHSSSVMINAAPTYSLIYLILAGAFYAMNFIVKDSNLEGTIQSE